MPGQKNGGLHKTFLLVVSKIIRSPRSLFEQEICSITTSWRPDCFAHPKYGHSEIKTFDAVFCSVNTSMADRYYVSHVSDMGAFAKGEAHQIFLIRPTRLINSSAAVIHQ